MRKKKHEFNLMMKEFSAAEPVISYKIYPVCVSLFPYFGSVFTTYRKLLITL